jgi:hypothetical protein
MPCYSHLSDDEREQIGLLEDSLALWRGERRHEDSWARPAKSHGPISRPPDDEMDRIVRSMGTPWHFGRNPHSRTACRGAVCSMSGEIRNWLDRADAASFLGL